MNEIIIYGYLVNILFCLLFLKRIAKASKQARKWTFLVQLVPWLGAQAIFIFYVWYVPSRQPKDLQCKVTHI